MADEFLVLNIRTDKDGTPSPVTIKLRPDLAPNHVARIKELATSGVYDGVIFHRVIPGFMAQGGDPKGDGTGNSDLPNLKAEFNAEPHVRGTCSMARTNDPNSANSQFFVCYDDAKFLDKQYTVWGHVIDGMEVIDALPKGEPPRNPGVIVSATITPEATGEFDIGELSPDGKEYASKLRDAVRPLLETDAAIRKHLDLNQTSAQDLRDGIVDNGFRKKMIDLRVIADMVDKAEGELTFTIRNKAGEELDLKPLLLGS